MKVLWFSVTPSLYDEKKYGGWIASLEKIVSGEDSIDLAIAFEHNDNKFKIRKNRTTYYIINSKKNFFNKMINKFSSDYYWEALRNEMLKIIDDFKPDIIQCFGSEWSFGRIAEYTNVPVVIHMQGFKNVYNMSGDMVYSNIEWFKCNYFSPKIVISKFLNRKQQEHSLLIERRIMHNTHYFMGRTDWDRNIVKYFGNNAKYYYCPEALRPEIYNSNLIWHYNSNKTKKIITITQAGVLKGNEIILRTAKLLKDQFNYDFEWEVAGNISTFKLAERKVGITHSDYNIKLIGMISSNEIAKKLATSDVYVHPAIIDNSPNSLCEAQVIGCPVISTDVGGISNLVEDNISGLLFPYNEPHSLAFKIMNLLDDDILMKKISKNERLIALDRHDPLKLKNTLFSIYKNILEDKNEL